MTNQVRPKMVGQRDRAKLRLGTFFPLFFSFGIVTMLFFRFLFKEGRSPIAKEALKKINWAGFKKSIILQKIGKMPVC